MYILTPKKDIVFSELERLLMEDKECQGKYTVVKYKEEVCISKVLKELVNKEETKGTQQG